MKIFIVEDDPWYRELISYHLGLNPEFEITSFESGKACLGKLHEKPDLITLDYSLPDTDGLSMLEKLKSALPDTPVIILSGQKDVGVAINLLKSGVYDYIIKDDDAKERLWGMVNKIRENNHLKKEISFLKEELKNHYAVSKVITGNSKAIQEVFKSINSAIRTRINVIIQGESGTGKELVAKAMHHNSPNSQHPFVALNVTAIPNELIESEFFGHEKGAFTGANTRKIGKLEEAGEGTLFLDEIAEMDINMQVKLLRVLQERELTRLGGNQVIPLKFRLVVASHKDLEEEVSNGRFREDLYYRLMGLIIKLPPLRNRGDDILVLAKSFADLFCKTNNLNKVKFTQEALDKLMHYHFPGNVRELKAIIELAVVLAEDNLITDDIIRFGHKRPITTDTIVSQEKTLKEYTHDIILHYLNSYDQNVMLVANKLGIGKSTIYNLLNEKEHDADHS